MEQKLNQENQLAIVVKQSGLEANDSQSLLEKFGNYEQIAKEWEKKAKTIVVTDASQTVEMAMAKEARKYFSSLRNDIEKTRKAMKEQSLRKGQAIDAVARFIVSLIAPIEEHLKLQEDFLKIQAAKKAEEARIAAEKKAEEERQAAIEAERKEQERIRLENEQLKKEAEAREKKIEEERKKAEAEKAEAERLIRVQQEKARLEKEEADKKLREEQAKVEAERLAAQKKLDEERAKAEAQRKAAEEARLAQEKIIAEQKAEAERKQKELEEKLKHMVECPNCHHKFSIQKLDSLEQYPKQI